MPIYTTLAGRRGGGSGGGSGLPAVGTAGNLLTSNGTAWVSQPEHWVEDTGDDVTAASGSQWTFTGGGTATPTAILKAGTGRTQSVLEVQDPAGTRVAWIGADGSFHEQHTAWRSDTRAVWITDVAPATLPQYSVVIGAFAPRSLTGRSNTLIGDGPAQFMTTGAFNVVVGNAVPITTGQRNTIVGGRGAGAWTYNDGTVNHRTAIGLLAEAETDGGVAVGAEAKAPTVSGQPSIQLGTNSKTYGKIGVGDDRLIPLAELKTLVAGANSWHEFQTAIASLT